MSRQKTLTHKPIDELLPLNTVLDEIGISRAPTGRRGRRKSPA
ncbi:hypothetical protein [Streptomyces sp. NPDC057889]